MSKLLMKKYALRQETVDRFTVTVKIRHKNKEFLRKNPPSDVLYSVLVQKTESGG